MWLNVGMNVLYTLLTITASIANAKGMLCFAAETGVLTVAASGAIVKKAIEDVKVGDRVMSYNEATGETEVKTVTGTSTSTHSEVIKVGRADGQVITSSLGHPYYTQHGWIEAKDLRAGDILQTVNGETVVVEFIQHELLEAPITLYNFSVDGNHSYYVAESVNLDAKDYVLTHNSCKHQTAEWRKQKRDYWKNEAKTNPDGWSKSNVDRMKLGKAPIGTDGYSMHLHHVDGIKNSDKIIALTRTEHIELHKQLRKLGVKLW